MGLKQSREGVQKKTEQSDPAQINASGWRQGSVLDAEFQSWLLAEKLVPSFVGKDDILIVIGHDCDICNLDFSKEPFVEILSAHRIPARDYQGSSAWTRSPRRLDFKCTWGGKEESFRSLIFERFVLPRELLLGRSPDKDRVLPKRLIETLQYWMANRYRRPAFPDTFNKRMGMVEGKIYECLDKCGEWVSGIYIFVMPEDRELPKDEDYEVVMYLAVPVEDYKDPKKRRVVIESGQEVVNSVNECEGIELTDFKVRSEGEIPIDEMHWLKRWDRSYLSLGKEPPEAMAPDVQL